MVKSIQSETSFLLDKGWGSEISLGDNNIQNVSHISESPWEAAGILFRKVSVDFSIREFHYGHSILKDSANKK